MLKSSILIISVSAAMLLAAADLALAQQVRRLTYEEAYARCKKHLDRTLPSAEHSQRHTTGAACMRKFGYRL